jgi:hypothetical protein
MLHAKQSPKRKRRCESLPILGVAGLSLTLASGASAAARSLVYFSQRFCSGRVHVDPSHTCRAKAICIWLGREIARKTTQPCPLDMERAQHRSGNDVGRTWDLITPECLGPQTMALTPSPG